MSTPNGHDGLTLEEKRQLEERGAQQSGVHGFDGPLTNDGVSAVDAENESTKDDD